MDWNPDQYLKFGYERTQASIDLAQKTTIDNPREVIDIGCGPGNSARVLMNRWPDARITGIDSSAEMIRRANIDLPELEWITGDASTYCYNHEYDVVFSNAALQWMQNHEKLVTGLFKIVRAGGALAVQVPADQDSPVRKSLLAASSSSKWSGYTVGAERLINYHTAGYYYGILIGLTGKFDLWETIYYHVLDSARGVMEWYKGTAMRPFLERLPDEASRREFEEDVLTGCGDYYPSQPDGRVLYPFKRIFFVAYK